MFRNSKGRHISKRENVNGSADANGCVTVKVCGKILQKYKVCGTKNVKRRRAS